MKNFSELDLPAYLQSAITKLEYTVPTPIQAAAIPVVMAGKDLIGCAQTGTGKTAAYLVPLLAKLVEDRGSRCLIMVPTRELAYQVNDSLRDLSEFIPDFRTAVLIGGTSMIPQLRNLAKNPRVIVATPGRLNDHLRQKSVSLATVRYFVLDEADRMLDLGFAPQIAQVAVHVPKDRQTLMFSATLPRNIRELANTLLRNPTEVTVDRVSSAPVLIDQLAIEVNSPMKAQLLLEQINTRVGSMLVFVRTKTRADRVTKFLSTHGVNVGVIHGDRSMAQRKRALDAFKDEQIRVLIATDIAARGIDVDHVGHVVNFDLPQVPEDYIHRIGRTGRAGRTGQAVTFVSPEEKPMWRDIEKLTGRITSRRDTSVALNPEEGNPIAPRPAGKKQVRHDQRDETSQPGDRRKEFAAAARNPRPDRGNRPSFGGRNDRKPFDNDRKPFDNDRKPFGNNDRKAGADGEQKPFANTERKPGPFSSARRPAPESTERKPNFDFQDRRPKSTEPHPNSGERRPAFAGRKNNTGNTSKYAQKKSRYTPAGRGNRYND